MARLSDERGPFFWCVFLVDREPGAYIVWAEDGQSAAVWANNRMLGQVIQGTIDLYTKKENDPLFQAVQKALNAAEISNTCNSVPVTLGFTLFSPLPSFPAT